MKEFPTKALRILTDEIQPNMSSQIPLNPQGNKHYELELAKQQKISLDKQGLRILEYLISNINYVKI